MGFTPVAAKPKPDAGDGKTTVKLRVDLHRKARTVASFLDLELTDYLDGVLRPIVDKAFADMARKIHGGKDE